jgi:peptidoglycan-associated lipoprotein
MNRRELQSFVLPAIFAVVVGVSSCSHSQIRKAQNPPAKAAVASSTAAVVSVPEPDVSEASLHIIAEVKAIHFDYDSAYLGPEARAILVQNADWLKSHEGSRVQAAGHCDERGTVEYNLALGQRRAQAVKDYYKALGIAEGRVATISYGKEKPLCQESTEECWQKNRMVETLVAFSEAVSQLPTGASSR